MAWVELVFWFSLAVVAYVYVGYPLLLLFWSRFGAPAVRKASWEPSVSVIVAAHNERQHMASKIADCAAFDYPADKLEIVVSVDGSSDGTEEVARGLAARHPGLRVVAARRHRGKAAAINRAVEAARGEVLVFCDARQHVEPAALRELVANLHDPSVGAASGELVLVDPHGGHPAGGGVGLYWRYEKALRALESRVHSSVGATGALYALRRELFAPLPEGAILDDVILPLRVNLAGRRTVFEPRARAFDRIRYPELEYKRKVRTLAGNYQLCVLMPQLLSPWRNPLFVQFLSHKVGRLAAPWFLLLLFGTNLLLRDGIYQIFLAAQLGWYGLAGVGAVAELGARPLARSTSLDGGPAR